MDLLQSYIGPTHAEAGAAIDGGWCPCGQHGAPIPPAWEHVEDGVIRGLIGGECPSCGSHNLGWAMTGAKALPTHSDDREAFVAALLAEAEALVAQERAIESSRRRAVLRSELADALAERPAELPVDLDTDPWQRWAGRHHVTDDDTGGDGPLYVRPDGTTYGWMPSPGDPAGDGIEVTEADIR